MKQRVSVLFLVLAIGMSVSLAFAAPEAEDHNTSATHASAAGHESDHGEGHDAAGGHGEESGPPHIPNLVGVLNGLFNPHHDNAFFNGLHHFELPFFSGLIGLGLIFFFWKVSSNLKMVPNRVQSFAELLIEGLYDFLAGILGSHEAARRHVPLLGTLFIYIWCNNMLGIVPLGHSPTGGIAPPALNTTAALAILVFIYVQIHGLRELGPWGYIHHLMGSPTDVIGWCLVPLMFPLHVLGEFIKPFSLAMRLFGNITGEDTLIAAFCILGVTVFAAIGIPGLGLPLHIPFIFLSLLLGTIQALVFTLLATVYILQMSHHHEEHGEGHEAAPQH